MTYEDETRKRIEARRKNAELKREQQLKKRKMTLGILAAVIVAIVVIIIVVASISAKNDREVQTTAPKETSILGATTAQETTVAVTTNKQETTAKATQQATTQAPTTQKVTQKQTEAQTEEETEPETEAPTTRQHGEIMHAKDAVNIRRKPRESSKVLDIVEQGDQVEVLSTEKGWCHVIWNGIEGYVSARFLK